MASAACKLSADQGHEASAEACWNWLSVGSCALTVRRCRWDRLWQVAEEIKRDDPRQQSTRKRVFCSTSIFLRVMGNCRYLCTCTHACVCTGSHARTLCPSGKRSFRIPRRTRLRIPFQHLFRPLSLQTQCLSKIPRRSPSSCSSELKRPCRHSSLATVSK